MNTKCNRSNYKYDYVFDLNDNILQGYDFKPMYYTNNINHVQPYNEQAQGRMPYKSSNTINTNNTNDYLKYAQDNTVDELKSKTDERLSDILNRNFNIKTEKKPYSDRGKNN